MMLASIYILPHCKQCIPIPNGKQMSQHERYATASAVSKGELPFTSPSRMQSEWHTGLGAACFICESAPVIDYLQN